MREWERGTGETIGCGTGCCTAFVFANRLGLVDDEGEVEQIDGNLKVRWDKKTNEVYMTGLCTDICVISNAMLIRAFSPETDITVYENCCAGVSPETHRNALEAMKVCQVNVQTF